MNGRMYGQEVWAEVDTFFKRAESNDPDKNTTHPVKNVDGGTQPASEGSRSAENTADVKKNVPNSVDAAPANITKGDGPALTNTTAKPTGEDSSNETAGVKSSPTDPGTTHPAKVGGEKYANLITNGDEILAELTVAGQAAKEAAAKKDTPPAAAPAAAAPAAAAPVPPAAAAAEPKKEGSDVPGTAAKSAEAQPPAAPAEGEIKQAEADGAAAAREAIKQAEAQQGRQLIAHIVKTAELDAENIAQYLQGFQANKQAALKKLAGGEEQIPVGPGGPMDAGGGLPPEAAAGAAGGGEMPPAAGGAGGGGEQELIQMLVQAIQSGQISPEEIIEALQAAEGGAGGGMPPEAAGGGMPPEAAGGMPPPEAAKAAALKARIKNLKPAEKSAALLSLARQGARLMRKA